MVSFVAAQEPSITTHPNTSSTIKKGDWSQLQIGFIPDKTGKVASVSYSLWTGVPVPDQRKHSTIQGYTHTVYDLKLKL